MKKLENKAKKVLLVRQLDENPVDRETKSPTYLWIKLVNLTGTPHGYAMR